jgi:thiamine biosynthesis protein ThiS
VTSSVLVNGRQTELDDGETVAGLLERLGLEARYALVERNGEALPRERYAKIEIENGDRLVIARPVAGG